MLFSEKLQERPDLVPGKREGSAGIYVHIPFCTSKCPYCSFVSCQDADEKLKESYMAALWKQAADMASHPWSRARSFHSLYIGGGTPSTIEASALAGFIAFCLDIFDFSGSRRQEPEVTVEVNPNTATPDMLGKLRDSGVNRLSIGTQSFADASLQAIGRTHSAREGEQAVVHARDAGFANISLDLMYGLPGQDSEGWQRSLEKALRLAPEHFSVYELTVEEGTPFAELSRCGTLGLPGEEETLSMFQSAREILGNAGYRQYEISNYARPGFESVHNVTYWENGSYLGLGCSAVSGFSGLRLQSVADPFQFISMVNRGLPPYSEGEFLPLEARFRESVVMGLRMNKGVSTTRLRDRFGTTPEAFYRDILESLLGEKLLEKKGDRLCLTEEGLPLANRVMAQLV